MTDPITFEQFNAQVGSPFRLLGAAVDGGSAELELIEATSLAQKGDRRGNALRQEPFSLLFRGTPDLVLPQSIYRLSHETLGDLKIFLVPVGPDGQGMRYEAVFN